jgi:hypothetical protein
MRIAMPVNRVQTIPLRAQCHILLGFYYYLAGCNFTVEFMSQ